MQIIGEKINGTRKQVAQAIANRDAGFIRDLARRQAEAGANWLDVNAGTRPDCEPQDLLWLVQTIQETVETPLCLDSANPQALAAVLPAVARTPLINSITAEPARLNGILPLVRQYRCRVIALAMDEKGIPATAEDRMAVIRRVMGEIRAAEVPDEHVYLDPLVMTISTNANAGQIALETMRRIHQEFPSAHITAGLSNVSFGLPVRALVNRTFFTLALAEGLDCAILDPLDRELSASLLATELLLGRDAHCLRYIRAHRAGVLEPQTAAAA